ncbi:MAG: YitT family protein [Eubacteriales bacterium]|nr:YitT family protein [Eubacteriales bacterium]
MTAFKNWFKKENLKKFGIDIIFVIVGCALGAFATIYILIPNGLTSGGITGICRILQDTMGINFSILYYGMAFVILVVCAITLGIREARKILLMTILFPGFLFIFEQINFSLLEEKDIILAAIYCGVFSGICSGLIFSRGYSFGGTDTIAKIIKERLMPQVGISKILLVIDAVIIVASGIFFGRNIALYALVTQIIFSRVVDYVMYGFESKVVQLEIITDKHDQVAWYIMNEIGRGVSNIEIIGEYTQVPRDKIITLCSPRESMLIKQYVAKVDKKAFITVIRVETVWGAGTGFNELIEK